MQSLAVLLQTHGCERVQVTEKSKIQPKTQGMVPNLVLADPTLPKF